MKKTLSIVIPCLNEERNIPELIPEIKKQIPRKYNYEIIFVDDGSTDQTSQIITRFARRDKKIKGVFLHKRFGHQAALTAGIKKASGHAIITMDSDFQHPPKLIPKFISFWEKGYDLVQAQKKEDHSASFLRKIERRIGYHIWNQVSGGVLIPGVSDFRLMDQKVAQYINRSPERDIFLRGLAFLGSRKPAFIKYSVPRRRHGQSNYTTKMFLNMFVNGFISFSPFPLRVAFLLGVAITCFSALYLFVDLAVRLILHQAMIPGWVSIITLTTLMNGLILLYLGLLGEYIGVIFREVKKRPKYIIKDLINL